MEERLTAPWSPWEAIPLAVVILAISVVLSVLVTVAVGGAGGVAPVLGQLGFEAAIFGVTLAWVGMRHPGAAPALRLRSRRPGRDAMLGALGGVTIFFTVAIVIVRVVTFVFETLLGRGPPQIEQITFELTPLNLALGVVVVVVAAPIAEEVFFRGFLYTSLRARFGVVVSVLISSAVFGLFHATAARGGLLLVPLIFFVGIGFALLFEWRRSLLASIAAHAVFNAIGYVLIAVQRTSP